MPLFKGVSSKSSPKKAIAYITNKKKASLISTRNLFEDEDYAEQFKQTQDRFGKGDKYNERKYYHFKLSCDRKDNVSDYEAHIFAEELTARLFNDKECVIATHIDTKTIHSHIIVNAVDPLTGKKLRITKSDYTKMKDMANELGKEMGFSELDFRKKSKHKRTTKERHVILKGGTSWKEELREVIEEAKRNVSTEEEFKEYLLKYDVKLTRSKSEYSYLHPKKQKAIRGDKLGTTYTKKEILNEFNKQRNRTSGTATTSIATGSSSEKGRNGERFTKRSVSDIQRELQELDRKTELAGRGLDVESGQDKKSEQQQLLGLKGRSIDSGKPNGENSSRRENVQNGDKPKIKTRTDYFSK